ncbi:MAG: ribosomal RNA small subunit methyltransferase A [Saprospirales bacterium]|nr:MAG: ribosomal RNA small subunit methyltransferase A [Saprospirales bacterium]
MIRAKKSYGQHFLINEGIAEKISDSLSLQSQYTGLLEVGPGKGVLTKYLLQHDLDFYAVEADEDMIGVLVDNIPEMENRAILFDFIKFDPLKVFGEAQFALIGNYPYNISSQIIFRMLKYKEQIPEMVGMFQKEMARRIVAPPGSKEYGIISVLTQVYYKCEYLFKVERGNFSPPPKVQSAVIRCVRLDNPPENLNHSLFKSIVKITFNNRRKMLRNTMKQFLKGSPVLENSYFDKRPEQLSVEEFVKLTELVETYQKNKV